MSLVSVTLGNDYPVPVSTLRRVLGIAIDWAACLLISRGLLQVDPLEPGAGSLVPLAVLLVEHTLLVGTLGTSLGHRLVGLRVVREGSQVAPGIPKAFVRSVLLCLVIPAVIWDASGRGMHDRLARTQLIGPDGARS